MGKKNLLGMMFDVRPQEQPDGTYRYGKNGLQHDTKGSVSSEPGFNSDPALAPATVVGVIETDGPAVLFSANNIYSYIGFYNRKTNSYSNIWNDVGNPVNNRLGLTLNSYVTGEFQRNSFNEVIVAFTDKNTDPKVLNCTNPPDPSEPVSGLLMFPRATVPTLVTRVEVGGSLEKGAYFASVRYLKNDGTQTGFIVTSGSNLVSADTPGTISDKALVIELSNLDQSFDKVEVAVTSRINGAYSSVLLPAAEITPGTLTLVHTGDTLNQTITLEEVLVPSPVYTKVGTMGQLNDALYIADLESEPQIDMQKYANLVQLQVRSELVDATPPPAEHITGQTRSLMHQEVYAIYIRYRLTKGGGWTKAFHIPGNELTAPQLALSTVGHEQALGAKVFQVRDTIDQFDSVQKICSTGKWQNETETYPATDSFNSLDIGGTDLRGEPVRHHRMPSIAWCKQNFYSDVPDYGRTKLDILSLEVSNVIIPAEFDDKIDAWEILIAKRTLSNSTVVGQGVYLLAAQAKQLENSQTGYTSTGANWNAGIIDNRNQTTSEFFGDPDVLQLTGFNRTDIQNQVAAPTQVPGARFRFHSFDMLFNRPATSADHFSFQLRMRRNQMADDFPTGGMLEDSEMSEVPASAIYVIDYTKGIPPTAMGTNTKVRVIDDARYVQNNVNTGEWDNTRLETAFVGKMRWIGANGNTTDNAIPLEVSYSTINLANFQRYGQRPKFEETYLVNLMDNKGDVYKDFFSQRLVISGQAVPKSQTSAKVYAGDTFICDYTFHTYGKWNSYDAAKGGSDPNIDAGYKIVRRFVCEAASNINLRFEIEGNVHSQYWPKTALPNGNPTDRTAYVYSLNRSSDPNQFGYSRDLNTLNDFGDFAPYNPYFEEVTEHPYRIHRGGKLPRQGMQRSWRTFLPLDYYEAQKNMGRIVRVVGKDDKLLIHHEAALFITQDKLKLESDVLSVTLGSGDIFQFEPQEVMSSKQGYAGTQHELACIDTPAGYIFVDARQGQVFWYKDGLKLMNEGFNQFFRKYLRLEENNPFTGNGITIGYDPEFKRVMVTVKNKVLTTSLANFVPNYEPTPAFFATLIPGTSVVYKDGRYQLFQGVNETPFECSDNLPPVGSNEDAEIDENSPNGTQVVTVNFVDPEGDPVTKYITNGNTGNAFYIEPVTGIIRVQNSYMLDFETTPVFVLTVRGITPDGQFDDVVVTITLNDVDEPPVVGNYEFSVPEDEVDLANVGQVIGVDPEGLAVSYELLTTGVPFSINTTTGMISLDFTSFPDGLDAETAPVYDLQVAVRDPALNASISNVRVLVTNVNEPPIAQNSIVNIYKGDVADGDEIAQLEYTDPEQANLTLTWLNQAAQQSRFAVDLTTRIVTIVDVDLLAAGASYPLNFRVTDPEGLYDDFTVMVQVYASVLYFSPDGFSCIGASCDPGQTLAPDASYCYEIDELAATPPSGGTPLATEARTNVVYSTFGSLIYDPGYGSTGTGGLTRINTANNWWRNNPSNTTDGPLNRSGLWAVQTDPPGSAGVDEPLNEWIGFTVPVNLPSTKTYYVGIAGDNRVRIDINGVTVVQTVTADVIANLNSELGDGPYDATSIFKYWHIFPVSLNSGPNVIEVYGYNEGSVGSFGAEIYDNTAAEIAAATSYDDLNVILTTADLRGQTLQLGGTAGWSCPSGYSLIDDGGGAFHCEQIVTYPVNPGYTKQVSTVRVQETDSSGPTLGILNNIEGQIFQGQAVPYYPDEPNSVDCGYTP